MKTSTCVGTTLIALLAASTCAPPGDDPVPTAPLASEFACPPPGFLDCMPIVPRERQAYCTRDFRDWITTNCPEVQIVY
jgi:hypothetical protein